MDDTAVTNLTERNAYESVVSQMMMLYKEARFQAERVAEKYKLTIDCECFGVKSGKMYICFFCNTNNQQIKRGGFASPSVLMEDYYV
jgi:hypothetical protein